MYQLPLFLCTTCGRDTLKHGHRIDCKVGIAEELARQTREKCKELGITGNLELFGVPHSSGDP